MGSKIYKASDINNEIGNDYTITYNFPITLLSAAILEIHSCDLNDDEFIGGIHLFMQCFSINNLFSFKIVLKKYNIDMKKNNIKYLKYIYGFTTETNRPNISIIEELAKSYINDRGLYITEISKMKYKEKYLQIENVLFEILTKNYYKSRIPRTGPRFVTDIKELNDKLDWNYELDHVIELKSLSYAIEKAQIDNFRDILIFLNYFNKGFNLRKISYNENAEKSEKIELFLKRRGSILDYLCIFNSYVEELGKLQEFYTNCHNEIILLIRNDINTSANQKSKFQCIDGHLHDIIMNK